MLDPCVGMKWIKLLMQATADESKPNTKEYILCGPPPPPTPRKMTNLIHRPPLVVGGAGAREVAVMRTEQFRDDGNGAYLDQGGYVGVCI